MSYNFLVIFYGSQLKFYTKPRTFYSPGLHFFMIKEAVAIATAPITRGFRGYKKASEIPHNLQRSPDPMKLPALYERLSRDDDSPGESVSIRNRTAMLEEYARQLGYEPLILIYPTRDSSVCNLSINRLRSCTFSIYYFLTLLSKASKITAICARVAVPCGSIP